jgi:hypothetical protein
MTNTQHLKQELEAARDALAYATAINDRYGMANAMRRIRAAKQALADSAPTCPTLPEAA